MFFHSSTILAMYFPGSPLSNSFASLICSYCRTFLASSPYSLSNSSTSSFVFPRFLLPSHVSNSATYPFHCTKNLSFPLTFLLLRIFSTLNFSSPLTMTRVDGVTFCPSTYDLYNCNLLMFTTGCILTIVGRLSSTMFADIIFSTL